MTFAHYVQFEKNNRLKNIKLPNPIALTYSVSQKKQSPVHFAEMSTYVDQFVQYLEQIVLRKYATQKLLISSTNTAALPWAVADWPTGKPGHFPVGPCFMKSFGPPAVHANLFHW